MKLHLSTFIIFGIKETGTNWISDLSKCICEKTLCLIEEFVRLSCTYRRSLEEEAKNWILKLPEKIFNPFL